MPSEATTVPSAVEIAVVKAPRTPKALAPTLDPKVEELKEKREAAQEQDAARIDVRPAAQAQPASDRANRYGRFSAAHRITVNVDNPKKVGSAARGRFDHYGPKGSVLTLEQALKNGITIADVIWDSAASRKFIKIDPPGSGY